jgi:hypothetical protein
MAEKVNWFEVVGKSNGQMVFLPAELMKEAQDIEKGYEEYNKKVALMAKEEIHLNSRHQNVLLKFREWMDKNGTTDIWVKDIGYNAVAMKEGKFIVNIRDSKAGPQ